MTRMAVSTAKSFSKKDLALAPPTQLAMRGLWLRSISAAIPPDEGVF